MKSCIYCGINKPNTEFSEEHIWPAALGGDLLPAFWRTNDVCRACNNSSGVFVDGAFIKSFFISGERALDALDYLSPDNPKRILPLSYLGEMQNVTTQNNEVADFWVCAPGANIVHFRSANEEDMWNSYAGGDPRRASKRSKAGRVVVALTTAEYYWILTALSSVKHHFPKADKFVTNLELPPTTKHFKELNPKDRQQAADLKFFEEIEAARSRGELLHNRIVISINADGRFLAKLGLAVGHKLFGDQFLQSQYGLDLRKAFREANIERRRQIPVRGSGYLKNVDLRGLQEQLRWPGGWVLFILHHDNTLSLSVQPPSGRTMTVQITDDPVLLQELAPEYRDGVAWLTVPPAASATEAISLSEYLAHQMGELENPQLMEIAKQRSRKSDLPPTNIPIDPRTE
jgi:hypothetical protein